MKLNRNDYTVEAAAGGGFYAYFILSSTYKCNFLGADNKQ